MQAAPPVSVRGTGGNGWVAVQVGLTAAAAASLTAWALGWAPFWLATDTPQGPLRTFLAALAALAAALGFGLLRWRACRGVAAATLTWDGRQWLADGAAGRLDVMIDLDCWMLLRFTPDAGGRTRWPAMRQAEAGAAWHGLRAAVHARTPQPVGAP